MNRDSSARTSTQKARAGALKERVRAAAHDAILDAAEEAFDEDGLDARMESIAARAGVAVGTLYNHFSDRKALVEALIQDRRRALLGKAEQSLQATASQPFRVRLEGLMRIFSTVDPRRARVRKALLETAGEAQAARKRDVKARLAPLVEGLVQAGMDEGVLEKGSVPLAAAHLRGLWRTMFDLALEEPEVLPLERLPEVVVSTFIDGAGRKRAK